MSAREMQNVSRTALELGGQEFNSSTLFGDHQELYELMLVYYIHVTQDPRDPSQIIACHIENGLHKMGHIRNLEDVAKLR